MLGPGVLQVVAKQSYCTVLKAFWYAHFSILAEYFGAFDQLGGIAFLFSIVFEIFVILLCLRYLSCSECIDAVLFVLFGEHNVHGFLSVVHGFNSTLCRVVVTPALGKSHPVIRVICDWSIVQS